MKWGGKERVKWAWFPNECSECEQWFWLEKYYRESSVRRYCLACDVKRELERTQRAQSYEDLYRQAIQVPYNYPGRNITAITTSSRTNVPHSNTGSK
jgi:hypothetical protein